MRVPRTYIPLWLCFAHRGSSNWKANLFAASFNRQQYHGLRTLQVMGLLTRLTEKKWSHCGYWVSYYTWRRIRIGKLFALSFVSYRPSAISRTKRPDWLQVMRLSTEKKLKLLRIKEKLKSLQLRRKEGRWHKLRWNRNPGQKPQRWAALSTMYTLLRHVDSTESLIEMWIVLFYWSHGLDTPIKD